MKTSRRKTLPAERDERDPEPPDVASTGRIQLEVHRADPTSFHGDGLVVPTVSAARMVEGLAARVRAVAGKVVEDEARRSAPIAVGAAVVTGAGALGVRHVVHVPLTEEPGMRIAVENVRRATRAGLLAASRFQLAHVGVPGMGYGEIGVPYDEAARAIIDEIRAFRGPCPQAVALLDLDAEMVAAFVTELSER